MFNLFPKYGSPGDSISPEELVGKNNNIYPTWTWSTGIKDADGKDISVTDLISKYNTLLNENKILREELESIEEDGTVEHNNAIKLREENAQLKIEIENWKKGVITWRTQYDQEVTKNIKLEDEILEYKKGNKNWMNLYQEVVDKNNDLLNKGGLKYMEAKLQIVQNNYTMCSQERDEFKHQLNAANKEIEALKKEKRESFEILKKAIEDESARFHELVAKHTDKSIKLDAANKEIEVLKSRVRDWEDKYAQSFGHNDMDKLQKEIEILKRWKKEQLTVQSWWDKVDSYVRDHDDAPLGGFVANTCLNFLKERDELKKRVDGLSLTIDRKNFEIDDLKAEIKKLKEDIVDYVIEKDDELKKTQDWNKLVHGVESENNQKHPMYPIHWGGYDVEEPWQCPCNKCKDKREGKSEETLEERINKLEKKVKELTLIKVQPNFSNISTSQHNINIKGTI